MSGRKIFAALVLVGIASGIFIVLAQALGWWGSATIYVGAVGLTYAIIWAMSVIEA